MTISEREKYYMRMKKELILFVIFCMTLMVGFSQQKNDKQNMNTALLIIDVQNFYFDQGPSRLVDPEKASENTRLILDQFRANGMPIIHVQHLPANTNVSNAHSSEIYKTVTPLANEKVVVKHFPNSFKETELLDYLKSLNIKNLVICGMMTHMCIDASVRAAKDFGFNCVVIGDACTTRDLVLNGQTVNAVDIHNSFLAALNAYYAKVKTTRQYLDEK